MSKPSSMEEDNEMSVTPASIANQTKKQAPQPTQSQPTDNKAAAAATAQGFNPLTATEMSGGDSEYRRVNVPPHRLSPLEKAWAELIKPIVEHMKLQVRYNTKKKCVELRTSKATTLPGALQKSADFVRAFVLGFELRDAVAILRLDDIYVDSFEIKDVKTLEGDNLSRAIGRIAGQDGKTKFTIENATQTRLVVADTHIHIMGSHQNIRMAKDAVVNLIRGSPPGKVFTQMRAVSNRLKERF